MGAVGAPIEPMGANTRPSVNTFMKSANLQGLRTKYASTGLWLYHAIRAVVQVLRSDQIRSYCISSSHLIIILQPLGPLDIKSER